MYMCVYSFACVCNYACVLCACARACACGPAGVCVVKGGWQEVRGKRYVLLLIGWREVYYTRVDDIFGIFCCWFSVAQVKESASVQMRE